MNKGFESTFKVIPINKIVLLRKSKVPHTFEQKIFSHFASHCVVQFTITQFGDEETSYGNLPLAIINQTNIIHQTEFISFAQFLYQHDIEVYLTQKAVIDNCLRLRDFNKVEAIEQQSDYWLLFNPLKRMRQFLNYRFASKQLLSSNISPDYKQNSFQINKAVQQFEQYLQIQGEFARIIQYLLIDYLIEHKNEISLIIKNNKKIMDFYRQGLPNTSNIFNPKIVDFIKVQQKQQEPEKKDPEQTLQAVLKTLTILSLVWMPWLFHSNSSQL